MRTGWSSGSYLVVGPGVHQVIALFLVAVNAKYCFIRMRVRYSSDSVAD